MFGTRSEEDWIFVVGAPRSGTTWLAKIFDSHPDVLYRHEPDGRTEPPADLDATQLRRLLRAWAADRSLRSAAKPPFFPKSWQPAPAWRIRAAIAYALRGAGRLPLLGRRLRHMPLPDLGRTRNARLVIKTVGWCDGIGVAARALPHSRTILILRRPQAQVFSVLRGVPLRKFELRHGGSMPLDAARAATCAAAHGVDQAGFAALPEAAQYAWGWVAFNEAAEQALAELPNVRIVLYEDLCENPELAARDILAFAGLGWHAQTAAFVRGSVRQHGPAGYYAVVQDPAMTTSRWRVQMSRQDQRAVTEIARRSALARHWPDLLQQHG